MAPPDFNPNHRPGRGLGRAKIGLNVLAQIAIVVLMLFMLNFISFNHYRRWDFSRNHFYALSDKTKRVLAGLKKKVNVYVFFQPSVAITPDVTNLLKEYQYSSNGKIDVENIDPYTNMARASELQSLYKFGAKENIVILDYDGRKKFVQLKDLVDVDMNPQTNEPEITGFKGEAAITAALLEVTDDKPNVLYAIAGHGERDLSLDDFAGIKDAIERENVKIKPLDLQSVDSIPADAGVLFILGPRYDFSEREINLLTDYWEKKGRILVYLDPNAQKQSPNLMGFLAQQAVKPDDDRVLRVEVQQLSAIAMLIRSVTADFVDGSPVTKNLIGVTNLFQGDTQSLTLDPVKSRLTGVHLQPLVRAQRGYWGETDYNIKPGDAAPIFLPNKDKGQPLFVAVSVEKGALAHEKMDSSRMIVVGNCDSVAKNTLTPPMIDFTVNSIDWLLDREELIGIAPKDYTSLTLDLSDDQMGRVLVFSAALLPALIAVMGFVVWFRRRH